MPYRETEPLRRWTLRSSSAYRLGLCLTAALVIVPPAVVFFADGGMHRAVNWPYLFFLAAPGAVAFFGYMRPGAAYRVAGGQGTLRLFQDRVEVPRADRAGVDVFPLRSLEARVQVRAGRLYWAPVSQHRVLLLVADGHQRALSEKVFDGGAEALEEAADTILSVRAGGPPEPSGKPKRPRDAYDDQLERELAALD